ncbi:MAG: 3'-5' exoribonuclease [Gammaproteobacteria bacterium]|jgi:exodeoxyribonuclease VIII|nr:3'-5' exoribonuclease [Gammaproteobacteria bacterium]
MIDLETMGTSADAAIIAIGAVRFDTEITDRFHCIVSLQSSVDARLRMDPSTILWWMQRSESARAQFAEEGTEIDYALIEFEEWLEEDTIVWGNGSDFDNAILANAYRALNLPVPWKFWNNRCYRTVKALHPEIKEGCTGGSIYHCAVDDAAPPRHLFSGIAVCGACGGPMAMIDARRYGCTIHRNRGRAVCDMELTVTRKRLEERLLAGIREQLKENLRMDVDRAREILCGSSWAVRSVECRNPAA